MNPSDPSSKPLTDLKFLLNHVFIPIEPKTDVKSMMEKFSAQLDTTLHQVCGKVTIEIPDLPADISEEEILAHRGEELQLAMEVWTNKIKEVIATEKAKKPESTNSAMAEIEFWKNRSAVLTTLHQQFNLPGVKRIENIMQIAKNSYDNLTYENFRKEMANLNKIFSVAKDNVKFLNTLERQFKTIQSGNLVAIDETLTSLMNGLRLVWTISRHYKGDEMLNLMTCIANEIADKVESQIKVNEIFKKDNLKESQDIIEKGIKVLEKWSETFSATRREVESGESHWPYDQKKLFERTKHITKVLKDLKKAVICIQEFKSFLGEDLIKVTEDTAGINDMIEQVSILSKPLEMFSKPFAVDSLKLWMTTYAKFEEEVKIIEDKTIIMIQMVFKGLRSAEGAFDLIQNLKNVRTRDRIKEEMQKKYTDILEKYGDEVRVMSELFTSFKETPPISKGKPPAAGKIAWSESIFQRVKKPIMKFKSRENLLEENEGKKVCKAYFGLGKEIRHSYQDTIIKAWSAESNNIATDSLKRYILKKDGETFVVDFDPQLEMMIREAKYMKQDALSNTVLNVALQEKDYRKHVDQLNAMLSEYNQTVGTLQPEEKKLLRDHIVDLNSALEPGLTSYNWHSLGIKTFIENCRKALKEFTVIKSQVYKQRDMIEERVKAIEEAKIVREFDWTRKDSETVMDLMEFYDFIENNRQEIVNELFKKYSEISDNLLSIEEITLRTKTKGAESMIKYYGYWEKRIFNSITTMVIRGLLTVKALFTKQEDRPALFKIMSSFTPPKITFHPSQQDIYNVLQKLVTNILESAKAFPRWQRGRCELCRPREKMDTIEYIHNYYSDVGKIKNIVTIHMSVNEMIERLSKKMGNITKTLEHQYKTLSDDKLKTKYEKNGENMSLSFIEFNMNRNSYSITDYKNVKAERRVLFMLIDDTNTRRSVKREAKKWLDLFSNILYDKASNSLRLLLEEMDQIRRELQETPSDITSMKSLLSVISKINSSHMSKEFKILEVEEMFRTIEMYNKESLNDPARQEHFEESKVLAKKWKDLRRDANQKNYSMLKYKERFAEETKVDVLKFQKQLKDSYKRYRETGPGASDTSLKEGVVSLAHFEEEVFRLNKIRVDLVLAEQLLGLSISSFEELAAMEDSNKRLKDLYGIYTELQTKIEK